MIPLVKLKKTTAETRWIAGSKSGTHAERRTRFSNL